MHNLIEIWHHILESNLFNFVLMLVLLNWIIQKTNLADKLEAGRKSIEDKINNSKLAKEKALSELFELQEKSKEIARESKEILEKSNANAVMVGEKIVEDAKKQAVEFGKNLDKIVESNTKATENRLKEETAKAAVKTAQDYIEKKLEQDKGLHIKFINESIDDLNGVEF